MQTAILVHSNRWRFIFFWPLKVAFLLWFLGLVGLTTAGAIIYFWPHPIERKLSTQKFESRIREIKSLKLAEAKPYMWRSNMQCKEQGSDCLVLFLAFAGKQRAGTHYFEKNEQLAGPCRLCHFKENRAIWQSEIPAHLRQETLLERIKSKDALFYLAAAAAVYLLFFLVYLLLRLFLGGAVLAFVCLGSKDAHISPLKKKALSKHFLYAEIGPNVLRGYMPARRLKSWCKLFFTSENTFLHGNFAAATLVYKRRNFSQVSFEGLRMTQGLANKMKPGVFIAAEELNESIEKSGMSRVNYDPVYKSRDQVIRFHSYHIDLRGAFDG